MKCHRFIAITLLLLSLNGFASHAALLVSLGMPDAALTAYFKEAHRYHIPILIRGLYRSKRYHRQTSAIGSFQATAKRMQSLIHVSKVGGISIDPIVFRLFKVHVVPALVVYDDHLPCLKQHSRRQSSSCAADTFDIVYGNLPLTQLFNIVAYRSTSSQRVAWVKAQLKHDNKVS